MRRGLLLLALAGCVGDGDDAGERCGGTSCAPGSLIWSSQAGSNRGVRVTAVANSPDEPPWFAGTFDRELELGGAPIDPPVTGTNGVFAARVGARAIADPWVATFVSASPVTIAGLHPDPEEGALLVTYGDIPGAGWSVDTLRVDHVGNAREDDPRRIAELVAPAENGVAAVTGVDAAGWPLVAISGLSIRIDPFAAVRRAVVVRLAQNLAVERLFDVAGVEINDLAPATAGTVAIGGRYQGTPPGWPPCPEAELYCGFAATIDVHTVPAGMPLPPPVSLFVFRASGGANVLAVGGYPDGSIAALCTVAGTTIEPGFGDPQPTLYLTFADATFSGSRSLSQSTDLALSGAALEPTDAGAVVAMSFHGTLLVDGAVDQVSSDGDVAMHDLLVAEYTREDDGTGWHLLVRTDATAEVSALAVEGSQVAVGGNYTGQLSIASGTVLDRSRDGVDGPVSQGFVLELVR